PVTVVAAGERWPDGSLRPALEDLLGAGAVIAALRAESSQVSLSPEADAARILYAATPSPTDTVRSCASALELVRAGFEADVDVATEIDAGTAVPVLMGGAFRAAPV
ncbi:MAG: 2-phosphosulfolactate phosphatase, partial [Actinomycetota bacterium]|nr:2-phosphosulfolactate phosphatase [Actinomycetota bacterium]